MYMYTQCTCHSFNLIAPECLRHSKVEKMTSERYDVTAASVWSPKRPPVVFVVSLTSSGDCTIDNCYGYYGIIDKCKKTCALQCLLEDLALTMVCVCLKSPFLYRLIYLLFVLILAASGNYCTVTGSNQNLIFFHYGTTL